MEPTFCYLSLVNDYSPGCRKYPSIGDWKNVITSLRQITKDGFSLNFGGPDALGKEGFFDLVSFSKDAGFRINVVASAYLIDESMSKKINDLGIEYINIFFDFPQKDEYGNFKSMKDYYHKVVDSISCLNRFAGSSLRKGISCVINGINLDYIRELENWAFRCNRIDWIQFMVLGCNDNKFLDKDYYKISEHENIWPQDTKKVGAVIDELIRIKKLGYKINNSVTHLEDIKSYYETPSEYSNKTKCKSESVIQVNATGDILLCHGFEKMGNIKTDDLKTVWQSEKALKLRESMACCRKNCYFLLNSCSEDGAEEKILETNKTKDVFYSRAILKPAEAIDLKTIPKPGFCCLGITNKCILKCKMCYKWHDDEAEEAPPTIEQYKKFISEFRDLVDENFIIHIGGGEALLSKDALALVKFCAEKGFLTNIASNGWLVDEKMAQKIAVSGLYELVLSLDSLNETTHDYLRGVKGVYQGVMNAINHMNRYSKNTKIGIGSVIYDCNLDELSPLLDWANNNDKINSIFFLVPMQPNNTSIEKDWWKGQYSYLWPKDTDRAKAFVDKLIEKKKSWSKIGNTIPQLEAFKLYLQSPGSFVKKTQCNLDRAVHVSAIGDVFLCYRKDLLGNIKDGDDIRDIWRSYVAAEVRQKIALCKDNCHYLINCFFEGDYPFGVE